MADRYGAELCKYTDRGHFQNTEFHREIGIIQGMLEETALTKIPSSQGRKGMFSTKASNRGEQCSRSKTKQNKMLSELDINIAFPDPNIRQVVCSAGVKFACVKSEHGTERSQIQWE